MTVCRAPSHSRFQSLYQALRCSAPAWHVALPTGRVKSSCSLVEVMVLSLAKPPSTLLPRVELDVVDHAFGHRAWALGLRAVCGLAEWVLVKGADLLKPVTDWIVRVAADDVEV